MDATQEFRIFRGACVLFAFSMVMTGSLLFLESQKIYAAEKESLESAIINGLSRTIANRVKSEFSQWFLDEISNEICKGIQAENLVMLAVSANINTKIKDIKEDALTNDVLVKNVNNYYNVNKDIILKFLDLTDKKIGAVNKFEEMIDLSGSSNFSKLILRSEKPKSVSLFFNFCNVTKTLENSLFLRKEDLVAAIRKDIQDLPANLAIRYNVGMSDGINYRWPFIFIDGLKELHRSQEPILALQYFAENLPHRGLNSVRSHLIYECSLNNDFRPCALFVIGEIAKNFSNIANIDINIKGEFDCKDVNYNTLSRICSMFYNADQKYKVIQFKNEIIEKTKIRIDSLRKLHQQIITAKEKYPADVVNLSYSLALEFQNLFDYVCSFVDGQGKYACNHQGEAFLLQKMLIAFSSGNLEEGLITFAELQQSNSKIKDSELMKNITFFISLASMRNGDDAAGLIDSTIAQVGYWKYKREKSMLSIGALGGMSYGRMTVQTPQGNIEKKDTSGFFAPIGFDVSSKIRNSNSTAGIFLSVIDLGVLAGLNFKEKEGEEVKNRKKVSFSDVYAPGLFFRIGLGKSPFVLGVGQQRVQKMLSVVSTSGETTVSTKRNFVFLAIDIPLFPLLTTE